MTETALPAASFRMTPLIWGGLAVSLALLYLIFDEGLLRMVERWESPEYSHGYLIPFIALYLIWQRDDDVMRTPISGSWLGVAAVLLGLVAFMMGELSTIVTIVQYAFLLTLYGLLLSLLGWRSFRLIAIPLFILVFMIPLPAFLYNNLSAKLQLISSEIGVWVIRQFGISVFLSGNVIDLGSYKLAVVEACSGLRYLFPLTTLGFIVAYFYHAAFWKRAVVFLSTIPITVLMNSFRIGVIGVMVEYWGQDMAEGFLHDFEGWVIFMACFAVLFLEMWLLMRLTHDKRPLREVFGLDAPLPASPDSIVKPQPLPAPFIAAIVVIGLGVLPAVLIPGRTEILPMREALAEFPNPIAEWTGRFEPIEQILLDELKLTDYTVTNYRDDDQHLVNFYVAYYESQRKGQSSHSPRSCLPGSGWEIQDLSQRTLDDIVIDGQPLRVNRVLIAQGTNKQLVYYWFQQRGRIVTNEYLVKWFIFWDALTRNRTDGALVRLVIPLTPGRDVADMDETLTRFAREVSTELPKFIPGEKA